MRLPKEMAALAPEADLRTVGIGRRSNQARLADLKPAFARANAAEDLFFKKGGATAETFSPPDRRYDDALKTALKKQSAVVELRPPQDLAGAADGDDELLARERAFIESHRRALIEGWGPEPDGDEPRPEAPSASSGRADACAPLADLRSLRVRRSARDAAPVDGLFPKKGEAGVAPGFEERGEPARAVDETQANVRPAEEPAAAPMDPPSQATEMLVPSPPSLPGATPGNIAGNDRERAREAVGGAIKPATDRKAAQTSLTALQIAIIIFGCVAVLASAGVVFPIYVPTPRMELPVAAPRVETANRPPPQAAAPPSAAIEDLLAQGDERLRGGAVSEARLFYEKAANAGNARGALMMGATYDPHFLLAIGVYGVPGDERAAAVWYSRARDLGDTGIANLAKTFRRQ